MKHKKTYAPELRAEAVKLVLAQGLTLEEAASHIAIPKGTLVGWVDVAKNGQTVKAAPGSGTVPELEAEVAKLRKELAETRMEREIVKKRQRISRRSRCQIRVHKDHATRLPSDYLVSHLRCLAQRVLCLAARDTIATCQDR
ncbi:MAG: transposase [Burkholderiales bacterium]|nr:transposase [Burkholderiales bacterium]